MNKKTGRRWILAIVYLMVTAGLMGVVIERSIRAKRMQIELSSAKLFYAQQVQLQEQSRAARRELWTLINSRRRIARDLQRLLGNDQLDQLGVDELTGPDCSTLVFVDEASDRRGVRVLTASPDHYEMKLVIRHYRHSNPVTNVSSDQAQVIASYEFTKSIEPHVWNRLGILNSTFVGEIPVVSVIDGKPEIVGELPEMRFLHYSAAQDPVLFVGIPQPEENGVWLHATKLGRVHVRKRDETTKEFLEFEATFQNAPGPNAD